MFDLLEELALARRQNGLSQEALASRVTVDRQAIYRLETGVGSFALLLRVMAALEYHVTGLARGMTLADQLENRRRALKLSKAEVARRADIMVNTVSAVEKGKGSAASALKVLAAIGTSRMARKKPMQVMMSPLRIGEKDKRFTPVALLTALEAVFGPISLDPCGHVESPVVAERRILLSEDGDGLRDDWSGKFCYMNPPFSGATAWLKRASEMHAKGAVDVVVGLVPAKTDSVYFQTDIVPNCDVGFLRGRIQYGSATGAEVDKRNRAPFATMLIAWGASRQEIEHLRSLYPSVWMMHERARPREGVREDALVVSEFG
ncbi:transcriptional regulator with XRE-family HTH domain [Novosphingobium fluoreni]|uniref:Transcriptional regulator with XRE-family HTH domain n=1 Tax=Novosphingobium fluoreni TaxID=1391222 RepID=A0A7W6FZV6_9SPHN|nr:DNA N-6-adenine-methyltransferase [Novosphingobium fluoreni]MBB3941716.1 transcriptional regulator with XRE-family HTH domain [Novosphingobium fluoreni]